MDERDVVSVLGGKEVRRGKEQVVRALERRLDCKYTIWREGRRGGREANECRGE